MTSQILIEKQTLENGMPCFIIPKKGYAEKQAALVVKYGGADFIHQKPDGTITEMPPGVAHFLEHKMFEDPELNMFEAFTQRGASTNAYTHFTHTVYYFNTVDDFQENLDILFRLVFTPHFTEENVEKEKGIILSEIDMYADNPYWQVYTGLHRLLFHQNPLRQDILGTRESVQSIQPNHLYDCYNNFYKPKNMALILLGDLKPQDITKSLGKVLASIPHHLNNTLNGDGCQVFHAPEPAVVASDYYEKKMSVSIPLYQIGFKAIYEGASDPITLAASSILADMVAGESSELFDSLYNQGMIDNQFTAEYIGGTYYGIFLFSGTGHHPKIVRDRILDAAQGELDPKRFQIIKNKHIGRYIRSFNSMESLSSAQADLFTKGLDINNIMEAFNKVTLDDVKAQQKKYLRMENLSLSVISPH